MENITNLESYFATSYETIVFTNFILNFVICAVLALSLKFIYVYFGSSLTDRKNFSRIFILLSLTTMLVITIIKSSFALSLGLVGALSVIRYRGAIKEPEELTYLFLCIAIGLGTGANQVLITIIAFILITFIIIFQKKILSTKLVKDNNTHILTIAINEDKLDIEYFTNILEKNTNNLRLKKYEKYENYFELIFHIQLDKVSNMSLITNEVQNSYPNARLNFLDTKSFL